MSPLVQLSLDLTSIDEALAMAETGLRAGIDWLEVGTPLIIAEGMHAVRALRAAYPETPIVADLKTMDGGYLEVELMAKAGATHVVVMGQAHEETVELVVQAGRDLGVKVMGDNMAMPDLIEGARRLAALGCDYVVHHTGYDHRTLRMRRGLPYETPLDRLREVAAAVPVPVQAVGGLTLEQAIRTPEYGAPLVVIGAPLAIDAHAFQSAAGDVESILRTICRHVHAYGDLSANPQPASTLHEGRAHMSEATAEISRDPAAEFKRLRRALGLSQQQLGPVWGKSERWAEQVEGGKQRCEPWHLDALRFLQDHPEEVERRLQKANQPERVEKESASPRLRREPGR